MNIVFYIVGGLILLWVIGSIIRHKKRQGKVIQIVEGLCTGCKKCLKTCRRNVLEAVKDGKCTYLVVKEPDNCSACGDCVKACKFKALEIINKKNSNANEY